MMRHYDRAGVPISVEDWMLKMTDDYKRVAQDTIVVGDQSVWVSTVWLGLDYSFTQFGPPLIFETMLFIDDDLDGPPGLEPDHEFQNWCERWSTEKEALEGHASIVARLRAWFWPGDDREMLPVAELAEHERDDDQPSQ